MLKKLKAHWNVNGVNLLLIIATFALGGSLCGYAGRKLLILTNLEKGPLWVILYILLVTLLWPICVIIISIPLGQFSFFKKYLAKVWNKLSGKHNNEELPRIAIFASGAGSNAEKIINPTQVLPPTSSLEESGDTKTDVTKAYTVGLIVCNKKGAGVLKIAEQNGIPALLIEKERFFNGDHYLPDLRDHKIDFIVLAGFLWKIPQQLIKAFPGKIINIHPALLPAYGGQGMYGSKVHEAVIAAKEHESGISVHYVDELYDHGEIIFQAKCPVTTDDTAETLAQKIHALEHAHYPKLISQLMQKQNRR
ncbi:MAG TPA: phosphoribosylglycinamide formyltransferase [Ferruginibacter sp.]|nr:phosphoribosylglycinamide formyltransferase [Ferruginibacter sp.]